MKFKIKRKAYDRTHDITDVYSFQNAVTYISKNDTDA